METTTQDPGVEARQNEAALAAAREEAVKAERLRAAATSPGSPWWTWRASA